MRWGTKSLRYGGGGDGGGGISVKRHVCVLIAMDWILVNESFVFYAPYYKILGRES